MVGFVNVKTDYRARATTACFAVLGGVEQSSQLLSRPQIRASLHR
jgi:hypothetical protein